MPTMLTAHPWPQPLVLTALFLLIAAAAALLACGPVAQQSDDGDAPTETPTPVPTVCIQGIERDGTPFEHCITPMPPKTPKYPNLSGVLEAKVMEFEDSQDAASGDSGQSGSAVEDSAVYVEIFLSSPNTGDIAAWLRSKGVSPFDVEVDAQEASPPALTYFVEDVGYIGGMIPLSLMGELSRLEGVVEVREPYLPEPAIVLE